MRACGEEMEIVKKRAQASIVKGVMRLGNESGLCRVTEGPQGEFALVRAPSSCSSTVAFGLSTQPHIHNPLTSAPPCPASRTEQALDRIQKPILRR